MTRDPVDPTPAPSGWPRWKWALLVSGALLTLGVELVALFVITVTHSSTCYDQPYGPDVIAGRRQLAHLALAVLIPWAVAAATLRPRRRVVVTALVCTSPAVAAWVAGQWTAFWSGGFCI